jgi:hypothetical protein
MDCREEEELCEEFGVFGTPTIKIYSEHSSDDGDRYTGQMNWKSISGVATAKMMNFVRVVHEDNYEAFLQEDSSKNKILIFTERKTTAPLFKSLSLTYKDKLVFGEVRKEETDLF